MPMVPLAPKTMPSLDFVYNEFAGSAIHEKGGVSMLVTNEDGQGLAEYALLFVLIALVVIVVLTLLGGTLNNVFSNIV
jgi:Flp pilus assembly pilin Flp